MHADFIARVRAKISSERQAENLSRNTLSW